MNEEELKPCPFCGETVEERDYLTTKRIIHNSDDCGLTQSMFLVSWNSAHCWKIIDQKKAALQAKDAEIAELKKQAADELEHKNYISNLLFLVDDELKRLKKSVEAGQMIDGRALWKARYKAERSRSEKLVEALEYCRDYDRSVEPEYGEIVRGKKPPVGSRWLTPKEKAQVTLDDHRKPEEGK